MTAWQAARLVLDIIGALSLIAFAGALVLFWTMTDAYGRIADEHAHDEYDW